MFKLNDQASTIVLITIEIKFTQPHHIMYDNIYLYICIYTCVCVCVVFNWTSFKYNSQCFCTS